MIALRHSELEVSDYNSCLGLKSYAPDVVVNTAAFHKTDQCEDEPLRAMTVNAVGARNVAVVTRGIGAACVYISTDYVFDGNKGQPYTEDDVPSPVNAYGISKLAGELFTRQNPKHYVIRVASLFGSAGASGKGGNFVETMLTKFRNKENISVIDDNWMSPTYTRDAAGALRKLLERPSPYGTYHLTNQGYCSWYQLTLEIFRLLGFEAAVTPSKSVPQPNKAKRPVFSALTSLRLGAMGVVMPSWQTALGEYLREKGYLKS